MVGRGIEVSLGWSLIIRIINKSQPNRRNCSRCCTDLQQWLIYLRRLPLFLSQHCSWKEVIQCSHGEALYNALYRLNHFQCWLHVNISSPSCVSPPCCFHYYWLLAFQVFSAFASVGLPFYICRVFVLREENVIASNLQPTGFQLNFLQGHWIRSIGCIFQILNGWF